MYSALIPSLPLYSVLHFFLPNKSLNISARPFSQYSHGIHIFQFVFKYLSEIIRLHFYLRLFELIFAGTVVEYNFDKVFKLLKFSNCLPNITSGYLKFLRIAEILIRNNLRYLNPHSTNIWRYCHYFKSIWQVENIIL